MMTRKNSKNEALRLLSGVLVAAALSAGSVQAQDSHHDNRHQNSQHSGKHSESHQHQGKGTDLHKDSHKHNPKTHHQHGHKDDHKHSLKDKHKHKDQPMVGVTADYGIQYWGIPYAEPPVGELRWKAPQPVDFVSGFSATSPGPNCPQAPSPFGVPSVSEDCLYLNVFQPKKKKGLLAHSKSPVMVWLHGGALTYGEGHTYDPQKLVEQGVVVVTLNYRLGALGFMAHPALSEESGGTSGNYGLMDQQAALRWVQKNIHHFGGDAKRVTVFGESAGGLSVSALMASPSAKGLFHRAIIQSGAYGLAQPTQQQWEMMGMGRAAAMGCSDQSAECLRSLGVEQILAHQDIGEVGWLPVVDGVLLPKSMKESFEKGEFHRVPVMQGTTRDEYSLFVALSFELAGNPVTADNYLEAITQLGIPAAGAPLVAASYPLADYASPAAALSAVGTDVVFACNSLAAIKVISRFVPTFGYEFNDPNAPQAILPPVSFAYGAYHSSELQYLFGTAGRPHGELLNREQKKLSEAMVRYWTSFAKYGSPNLTGAPLWVRYGDNFELMQSLAPSRPSAINNFSTVHKCDLWEALQAG